MEANLNQKPLKRKKIEVEEEEKMPTLFNNNKREITQKEYDNRVKNCNFFMRSPLSHQIVLEIRGDSKKKTKEKKKQRTYFHLQFKSETKNNNSISFQKTRNKQQKNSYINLQPRKTWLNCQKIYNKCLIEYNPDEYTKENRFLKKISEEQLIENKNLRFDIQNNIEPLSLFDKPIIRYTRQRGKTKSLHDINLVKNNLLFKSINMNLKFRTIHKSNFVRCMNKSMSLNFFNKGINDILENINLEKIKELKDLKLGKDPKEIEKKKKLKIKLSYRFERKRLSLINIKLPKLEMAKKMGISLDFQYKIHSFFYDGRKNKKNLEEDEENDLEIMTEQGNFVVKESKNEKEDLNNYKEDQSEFNYFCLKNLLRLDQFHMFGLISGKGKDSKKCSRLLKTILVNKFSAEKNYINDDILENNRFKQKIDYIFFLLIHDDFKYIKDIFNSLETELIKMGIDVENTGATLSLIFFIKDKIISVKIGDVHPYFIYNIYDEKLNNNIMIRNPHYDHNLNNILEQDRLEENKCIINVAKNKIGNKFYKIEYKYDEDIQKELNGDNIKSTRMIGYKKLNKIGIINKPDIQTFSMDISKLEKEKLGVKNNNNKNPHASDYFFSMLIKKKGFNFTDVILKFVILGNDELFDIMKNSYYIKEINEAMIRDEINNKNIENIKYCFNLKKTIRKLVNHSVDLNNKYMSKNNSKDLFLGLVTLDEN